MPGQIRLALLHGLGADRRAFQRFERLLPDEWQLNSLDLLGHGRADKPQHGYSLADHADYVASSVGDEPTFVLGHSLGAAVALALAARHAHVVRGLVLLDPPGGLSLDTGEMGAAKTQGTVDETVERLYPDYSAALRAWVVETWNEMSQGVLDELEVAWQPYAALIRCPATVIHGDAAAGATGVDAARQIPGSADVRIEGAGHYLHATHARETAAAVVEAVRQMSDVAVS